ncbi:MAG: DUF4190 domain-containing protein [Candidatus Binatia bacterium]
MKKCPTCEKTFEDSLRFCQSDGSPLVAVEEVIDPYKTMVARPGEIAAAMPPVETPKVEPPNPIEPVHEEEVLEIPTEVDPNKTMFVSEADLRREMEADSKAEEPVIEMPPAADTPAPPAFIDADLNPVNVPPPTPIAENPDPTSRPRPEPPVGSLTSPPIPSPFGSGGRSSASDVSPMVPQFREPEPKPEAPSSLPSFDEPEPAASAFEQPVASPPFTAQTPASPFDSPSPSPSFDPPPPVVTPMASTPQNQQMAQAEWTPPPVPTVASTPSKPKEKNMTPPGNVAAGQSSTLAIISLVLGILSCLCCFSIITGPIAAILGFMARGKATKDPGHYGGAGLALGGIILGVVGLLVGLGQLIYIALNFAYIMSQMR